MRFIPRTVCFATLVSLLAGPIAAEVTASPPPGPPAKGAETSFEVADSYTAQRRPRVTVLEFEDTNKHAKDSIYGSSVEAMLVTFLKRKSQFVVVERQKLGSLLLEKKRLQAGMVSIQGGDKASRALLEKIDVFVFGSITLLQNAQIPKGPVKAAAEDVRGASASAASEGGETAKSRAERIAEIPGDRIEIDAKLISRFDGRIIAAVQRSGPVACLRSIVERLGVGLEQEFLRPYYGKLTVNLNNPEYVRVHLTPILLQNALDEEKPPVELSSTVTIDTDYDRVEPWTMDPTTYTITNLLSGWYSMRLERPGYEGEVVESSHWEVRKILDQEVVYDRATNQPLDKTDRSLRRFVVRVDPLKTEVVHGDTQGFSFRRQGGSIAALVKRQYLDDKFSQTPQRVVLMGGEKITLNDVERPDEYADDARCDLFDEQKPVLSNYGRTYIGAGQSFSLDSFTGGELIIENYRGEVVPVGTYKMAIWEPSYQVEEAEVRVHDKDTQKPVKATLTRETAALELEATGPRPSSRVTLEGQETHYQFHLPLDFPQPKELQGVPVDAYKATTDIAGLTGWNHTAAVPARHLAPPFYDTDSEPNKPKLIEKETREIAIPYVGVKTRFVLAGRLEALSRIPDPLAADMFIDHNVKTVLNLLLYGVAVRPGEVPPPDYQQAVKEVGRAIASEAGASGTRKISDLLPGRREQKAATLQSTTPAPVPDAAQPPGTPAPLKPDPFPRDPDALRRLLAQHLAMIDLLVLDPVDMAQVRRSPEVAGIIARYVASGGSLFAFAAAPGDYQDIVGAPFTIDATSKPTKRFEIAPGDLSGIVQASFKKRPKVKAKRPLPEIWDLAAVWRVIAYTKPGKLPRIIERGTQEQGGYVALWLDDPDSFRGHWLGGTRAEVEQTRASVEDHVMKKARELMRSRFDPTVAQSPCLAPAPLR